MAEETTEKTFDPITSQEEFDTRIKARLERERAKFSGYDEMKDKLSEYEKQLADAASGLEAAKKATEEAQAQVTDRDQKLAAYETESAKVRAALAAGLPYDMASRLKGNTAEELAADAEALAGMMKPARVAPLPAAEQPPAEDGVLAAFRKLNPNLFKN